jgi:outer membrane lipoprotein SlyB
VKKLFALLLLSLVALGSPLSAMADECSNCGKVKYIEQFTESRSGTGGAIAGAVVGGLLGNQVGGGTGKTVATVAGAAGGAYAGKKIAENSEKVRYRVTVRMDDGSTQTVEQGSVKGLQVGSLVKISSGKAKLR